jgi:sulfate transport system substrate-binding protein
VVEKKSHPRSGPPNISNIYGAQPAQELAAKLYLRPRNAEVLAAHARRFSRQSTPFRPQRYFRQLAGKS